MPTFQVTCVECGEDKWPTLPERPVEYTCVLCTSKPPEIRAARRAAAAKAAATKAARAAS